MIQRLEWIRGRLIRYSSDDEAKRKAAALGWDDNKYPTVYFGSDTTGEKAYEEFYVSGEKIDKQRFKALGVFCQTTRHQMDEEMGSLISLKVSLPKKTSLRLR